MSPSKEVWRKSTYFILIIKTQPLTYDDTRKIEKEVQVQKPTQFFTVYGRRHTDTIQTWQDTYQRDIPHNIKQF
jgi:hypothetical protein